MRQVLSWALARSPGGCPVCAHVWTEHDTIAARYCIATVAGKFDRGCVCTTDATVKPPG